MHRPVPAKILQGHHGLGVPDPELLQKRAFEIARIQERAIPNMEDWEEADRELHGHRFAPSQSDEGVLPAELAPGPVEHVSGTLELDDALNLVEELIREGMEEAEHERMLLGHSLESAEETGQEE